VATHTQPAVPTLLRAEATLLTLFLSIEQHSAHVHSTSLFPSFIPGPVHFREPLVASSHRSGMAHRFKHIFTVWGLGPAPCIPGVEGHYRRVVIHNIFSFAILSADTIRPQSLYRRHGRDSLFGRFAITLPAPFRPLHFIRLAYLAFGCLESVFTQPSPEGLTVYYCIADFAELTPYAVAMMESERSIIELSDVVFAQCEQLADRCSQRRRHVEIFPFGVNLALFTSEDDSSSNGLQDSRSEIPEPALISTMMSKLPRPVIGYVGGIHRHFDTEMLAAMARARPDWSWVLIGPVQTELNGLKQIPNVHLFGPKAHKDLPEYIVNIGVGIVPYLLNDYTMTVVPTSRRMITSA
jgi:hypothetical protein